jgi:hypothetical protein
METGNFNCRQTGILIVADQYALNGNFRFLPFVQDWVLKTILDDYLEYAKKDLRKLSHIATQVMGLYAEAQVAKALGRVDWVRSHKETWRSAGPWDRRAIIAAGAVLPEDERTRWRKTILASEDPLDRAMAAYYL